MPGDASPLAYLGRSRNLSTQEHDTTKNVALTSDEALLIGAALNATSALAVGDAEESFLAVETYVAVALHLGMDGQQRLAKKLQGQFNLFVED